MQIIIDTVEQCIIGFYPNEADKIRSKYNCYTSNKTVLYAKIVSDIKEKIKKTVFAKYNHFNSGNMVYAFHEFKEVLIIAMYANRQNYIFVNDALKYREMAIDKYISDIGHYVSDNIYDISAFAKVSEADIGYVYRYKGRFYFNIRSYVSEFLAGEFLMIKSSIPKCVLEEYGELIIKKDASRILIEFY